jgi:hypothetical protein
MGIEPNAKLEKAWIHSLGSSWLRLLPFCGRVHFLVHSWYARPQIREKLIEQKMLRWRRIAKYSRLDSTCLPARARRNYWRLCARYPELMRRMGLSELSVYQ